MTKLAGKGILVTRAAEDAAAWAERIREAGGRPILFPCVGFRPIADPDLVAGLRDAAAAADWVVFTSRRAVEAVAGLIGRLPLAVSVAAVSELTARDARRHFGRADLVGTGGAAELARALASTLVRGERPARGTRVVVPSSDRAEHEIEAVLEPLGVEIARFAVYRTVPLGPDAPGIDLKEAGVDVIFLASPSAVEGLACRAAVPPETKVITIGPTTTRAARAAGLTVSAEARRPDIIGLLEAIP